MHTYLYRFLFKHKSAERKTLINEQQGIDTYFHEKKKKYAVEVGNKNL